MRKGKGMLRYTRDISKDCTVSVSGNGTVFATQNTERVTWEMGEARLADFLKACENAGIRKNQILVGEYSIGRENWEIAVATLDTSKILQITKAGWSPVHCEWTWLDFDKLYQKAFEEAVTDATRKQKDVLDGILVSVSECQGSTPRYTEKRVSRIDVHVEATFERG